MSVGALGMAYVACGVGCALVLRRSWLDAALLLLCWPLYAPFLWPDGPETSLSDVLPGDEARRLHERIGLARRRAARIDALLATPDFDAEATRARVDALHAAGHDGAAEVAQRNLRHIERLSKAQERAAAELAEVDELLRQIRTQAAVIRLSGGSATSLVDALVERVESLDEVLDDELLAT